MNISKAMEVIRSLTHRMGGDGGVYVRRGLSGQQTIEACGPGWHIAFEDKDQRLPAESYHALAKGELPGERTALAVTPDIKGKFDALSRHSADFSVLAAVKASKVALTRAYMASASWSQQDRKWAQGVLVDYFNKAVVGTDGHRMHVADVEVTMLADGMSPSKRWREAIPPTLPKEAVSALLKMTGWRVVDIVVFGELGEWLEDLRNKKAERKLERIVAIAGDDFILTVREVDQFFADWKYVVDNAEKRSAGRAAEVDPREFASAVEAAAKSTPKQVIVDWSGPAIRDKEGANPHPFTVIDGVRLDEAPDAYFNPKLIVPAFEAHSPATRVRVMQHDPCEVMTIKSPGVTTLVMPMRCKVEE